MLLISSKGTRARINSVLFVWIFIRSKCYSNSWFIRLKCASWNYKIQCWKKVLIISLEFHYIFELQVTKNTKRDPNSKLLLQVSKVCFLVRANRVFLRAILHIRAALLLSSSSSHWYMKTTKENRISNYNWAST